jgi:hypothetical protein
VKFLASVRWWWLAILVIGVAACGGGDESDDDPSANEAVGTMPVTQAAEAIRTSEVPPTGTAARASEVVLREAQLTSTSGRLRTSTTPADPQDTPTVISTSIPMTAASTSTPTASSLPTLESIPTATELVEPTPDFPDLGDSEATQEPGDGRQTTVTVLGGSGSAVTEPVWLEAGLVVFRLYNDGPAGTEFRVVSTQTGAEVDSVAVPAGVQVAGSGFAIEAAGEYAIDVTGESEWTINLVQPIAEQASVEGLPWEWADAGPQVFYFVELPGGRTPS